MEEETSESGSPIYKYGERTTEFTPVSGGENLEVLEAHIEKHVGEIETVFHELISDLVHIDVHQIPPTDDRPFWTLVTTGMSDLPMTVPEGAEAFRYSELFICLPKDWKLSEEAFEDERNYWPVRWLKQLARFPHEYQTWLSYGHTMPNGDPAEEFAPGVGFSGMLLEVPISFDAEFGTCEVSPDKSVNFWSVMPLYTEEMDYKLQHGTEALEACFDEAGMSPIVQVGRPNSVKPKRKKFLGLF